MLPLLLSRRQAAKLLGISRNGSLSSLINRGLLTLLLVNGREVISREQVEAFARVGEVVPAVKPRKQRNAPDWRAEI